MPEQWRRVGGVDGYEVSDHGSVRSVPRTVIRSNGSPIPVRGRVLALYQGPSGHMRVKFRDRVGHPSIGRLVHVLVLEAFVGPRPATEECRHLDGDPANNHLSNLVWGSRAENIHDRIRHGTHAQINRTACPRGHILRPPNLIAGHVRRGYRACLACHRARSRQDYLVSQGVQVDLSVIADAYLREILGCTGRAPSTSDLIRPGVDR